MKRVCRFVAYLGLVATLLGGVSVSADDPLLFVSSFKAGEEGAIHAFKWNLATGVLSPTASTTDVEHPFFLALSPDNKFLYSIHAKQFSGPNDEEVAAYKLEGKTGKLTLLNRQSSLGTASCYLDVDATGKTLVVANYTTGDVASLPIKPDGSLGPAVTEIVHKGSSVNASRQKEPHAHCFVISPDNRFALAADLGTDQVFCYRLDAEKSTIAANDPAFVRSPPGSGPRHLTFHPNGKRVYVINELLNTVSAYNWADGTLTEFQTISTLPEGFTGVTHTADVKITPNGKFLYGTNRGHDSLAAYSIGDDGKLTLIEIVPSRGAGPQNLLISPDGKWLLCANMPGNNLSLFAIDQKTGKITPQGETVQVAMPSCLMLVP
ncbi:MAG: lactonase family protein [Planctomycetaceae bacterium]|nr:lactonase family protein [Planctomycetaceae bacterium]